MGTPLREVCQDLKIIKITWLSAQLATWLMQVTECHMDTADTHYPQNHLQLDIVCLEKTTYANMDGKAGHSSKYHHSLILDFLVF